MKKRLREDNYANIQCRILVLVHCPSSHCHLSIKSSIISIPFILSKIWPEHTSFFLFLKKWLRGDNTVNIQGRIMVLVHSNHFLTLKSIYKPSFILFPFVLSKVWPGQASIMTNTKLREDNSISIQRRSMVLRFCPSSHCHLSINQVSFQSILYSSRYGPDRQLL